MKKILCFLLTSFLLLSLVGCSGRQAASTETDMGPDEIAAAIQASQRELPTLTKLSFDDIAFADWLDDYYLLQTEQIADGVICYADGVEASEIAVLLLTDEKNSEEIESELTQYIGYRAGAFEGYAPEQAAMAREAIVSRNGRYIALLICPDPQAAKTAFLGCFGEQEESGSSQSAKEEESSASTPAGDENKADQNSANEESDDIQEISSASPVETEGPAAVENIYHADAVLQAWRTGDETSLSEIDKSILNAAKEVIQSKISEDMSNYEKELAIHDFITDWSKFDYSIFGRSASDGFAENSDTPYGVLIDRSAMCHGYSSTFQLFMDMLDIECITVFGTPGGNGVEHSWNMVKLDGEWYCVDCAWDDPIGGSPTHSYFNVTSDYLRRGSIHRWDDSTVPEATGTVYAYGHH